MKNPVRNLVAVTAPAPETAAAARAAVLALARAKDPEGAAEDSSGRIVFTIEWEPAFKDLKEISTQFKDVTFALYGDSFAKQHWVSKTVYAAGKTTEDATFSRIDGISFRRVYHEIFGEPFAPGG
ncbi:MAG: hypothetical protein ABSH19_06545 [Opitutales bacterium]|jgi:hypothetical protein